jgi:hypothetical protein
MHGRGSEKEDAGTSRYQYGRLDREGTEHVCTSVEMGTVMATFARAEHGVNGRDCTHGSPLVSVS